MPQQAYNSQCQDRVAGLFSLLRRNPSLVKTSPVTVLAIVQERSSTEDLCFMPRGRIATHQPPAIGTVFDQWTVEKILPGQRALCRCVCGNTASVRLPDLRNGSSTKCRPCVQVHGGCKNGRRTPEYTAWQEIQRRTSSTDPQRKETRNYAEQGISVAPEWIGEGGFERFLACVGLRPSPQHSLDRYPNQDGNYEPGNVRWATATEQNRNKHNNLNLTFRGKTQCASAWEYELGFTRGIVHHRIRKGWDVERALTTPSVSYRKKKQPEIQALADSRISIGDQGAITIS